EEGQRTEREDTGSVQGRHRRQHEQVGDELVGELEPHATSSSRRRAWSRAGKSTSAKSTATGDAGATRTTSAERGDGSAPASGPTSASARRIRRACEGPTSLGTVPARVARP